MPWFVFRLIIELLNLQSPSNPCKKEELHIYNLVSGNLFKASIICYKFLDKLEKWIIYIYCVLLVYSTRYRASFVFFGWSNVCYDFVCRFVCGHFYITDLCHWNLGITSSVTQPCKYHLQSYIVYFFFFFFKFPWAVL